MRNGFSEVLNGGLKTWLIRALVGLLVTIGGGWIVNIHTKVDAIGTEQAKRTTRIEDLEKRVDRNDERWADIARSRDERTVFVQNTREFIERTIRELESMRLRLDRLEGRR